MASRLPSRHAGAEPVEQRLALDPVHEDQRIPLAVAGRADAAVAVLEIDQAAELAALQVGADQVVAFAALGRFGGEHPQGERAFAVRVDTLVDHGERARPGPGLVLLVLLDGRPLQPRIAERDPRVLQHRAEVGSQRPGHGSRDSREPGCRRGEHRPWRRRTAATAISLGYPCQVGMSKGRALAASQSARHSVQETRNCAQGGGRSDRGGTEHTETEKWGTWAAGDVTNERHNAIPHDEDVEVELQSGNVLLACSPCLRGYSRSQCSR